MQKVLAVLVPIVWCALLWLGFLVLGATGHDDPHINFWFSHTLLEYGQMINYNGDRVEQTTSLLLVLLTALFTWILPFKLVTCGYLVDIVAALACCVLLTRLARRLCPAVAYWPAWLMLSSISFSVWTYGGMGAVLAALVMLCVVAVWWSYLEQADVDASRLTLVSSRLTLVSSRLRLVAVTLAMVLVRPEFPLVLVAVSLFILLLHGFDARRRMRCLHIVLVSVAASAALLCWQKYYFSAWFPLPVSSKAADVGERLMAGLYYVGMYAIANPAILLALLAVPVVLWIFYCSQRTATVKDADATQPSLLLLLASFISCYFCFVWFVGGDWMQAGRFMVPMVPMAALLAVAVLSRLIPYAMIVHLLVLPLLLLGFCRFIPDIIAEDNHGVPVWTRYRLDPAHENYSVFEKYNQEHLRDMAVIDHMREMIPVLHQKLGRPVRLLSGQAGMVFYRLGQQFPGRVDFSDMRGLVESRYIVCPLLKNAARSSMGLAWDYREFLTKMNALKNACGIEYPDVIYDLDSLGNSYQPDFERAGYTLVHREEGYVLQNDSTIPTHYILVPNMIYLRNDLLPLLGSSPLRVVAYKELPLVNRPEYGWLQKIGISTFLQ